MFKEESIRLLDAIFPVPQKNCFSSFHCSLQMYGARFKETLQSTLLERLKPVPKKNSNGWRFFEVRSQHGCEILSCVMLVCESSFPVMDVVMIDYISLL